MAISDPPKKPDTPRPINFKSTASPGFRAPQPRRFALAIDQTSFLSSKYFDDFSSNENVDIVSDQTIHEQSSTLCTVLKSDENDAEVTLTNLNSKNVNEKLVVGNLMSILRNVLRILKEDAVTISNLRVILVARIDEYVAQVDNLTRQLDAAEEEKKYLESIATVSCSTEAYNHWMFRKK